MGIPNGVEGVKATLSIMSKLVHVYKKNTDIRHKAILLTNRLEQKDLKNEIKKLFNFVKYEIRYVRDIKGVETIQTPDKTIELKAGDCDDKSVLLASMLESIGYSTRFVAVGFAPNSYCHVYPQVKLGKKWVSLETTEPVNIGWNPPNIQSRMVVHNK
jgi:hypothetical protein